MSSGGGEGKFAMILAGLIIAAGFAVANFTQPEPIMNVINRILDKNRQP